MVRWWLNMREAIEKIVREAFQSAFAWQPETLELTNPEPAFGDFSVACHSMARELKKAPQEIAEALAGAISDKIVTNASAVGGYLNITVAAEVLAAAVLPEIIGQGHKYGASAGALEKVLLEYSSPNTNKPLHLGHIRNNVLGMAVAKFLEATGAEVTKVQIINDRGIHIIKSMLAYRKWGEGKTPEEAGEKGDHFVGKFYVLFEKEFEREWQLFLSENPEVPGLSKEEAAKRRQEFFGESTIGREAQEMLRQWEAGDKGVLSLWKQMNEWVYAGFKETYQKLRSEFDKDYYESDTYLLGKKIVEEGVVKGVFYRENDGSVWVDLTDVGLDKKILQRKDGTSVYVTQDLGLAVTRQKELGFDGMVYVVGHEQEYHFKVLFAILKKLGYAWADKLRHLSYGLVFLPEGKMKSREGKVVDADDIIAEVESLATAEVKKRFPKITDAEAAERGRIIGIGALKFMLLRVTPSQPIHYNPAEAISFEGATGPYVQYSHARISSILAEETPLPAKDAHLEKLVETEEKQVVLKLSAYPEVVREAAGRYNPSALCTYLVGLSQVFGTFYHKHQVLRASSGELKHARLALIKAVQITLQNGLAMLGIEAPEKM
ncbi:MAG: arginine--tRNA ligase [Parcubacteria group bacterium]|nr:arginine--tRNA ligase [Parcubacteria group bacterium]